MSMKKFQCTKCGKVVNASAGNPSGFAANCPSTATKQHVWKEVK